MMQNERLLNSDFSSLSVDQLEELVGTYFGKISNWILEENDLKIH
jgi:hypothetical protein